ncbi:MAG: exo-alpha-sialidase [Bacteroidetes bacterium]|nr:exo-alpha-sialidase [Bacteroidota bacterium]
MVIRHQLSRIIFLLILSEFAIFIGPALSQDSWIPYISQIKPSLVDENHTSDGFMVTLGSGRIIHFFRIDEGEWGDHAGNTGKIVKRYSDDQGNTWSYPSVVYADEFDDRNITGALLDNDVILLTFRRYEAYTVTHVDANIIISTDGGETWSERRVIESLVPNGYVFNVIPVPGRGFMMATCTQYYVDVRFSPDGSCFDTIAYSWDYRISQVIPIGEPVFTYVGDGKIIGLFRSNFITNLQVVSDDYGYSWSEPDTTNIADGYYVAAPQIFHDDLSGDTWAVACDRRGGNGTAFLNYNAELWLYRQSHEDIFYNPKGYNLFAKYPRPIINYYRFYGYPVYTHCEHNHYLVVFTDCFKKINNREDTDFFQFDITYENVTFTDTTSMEFSSILAVSSFPNPANELTTLTYYVPQGYKGTLNIHIYSVSGEIVETYEISDWRYGYNELPVNVSAYSDGTYIYGVYGIEGYSVNRLVVAR